MQPESNPEKNFVVDEHINGVLRDKGILMLDCPFDSETLSRWNKILDPIFAAKGDVHRTYLHPDELLKTGIWDEYWNNAMRSLVRSFMPDAVIETFDCYENGGKQAEMDMYDEINSEWHRDIHDLPGVAPREPFYCSLFIYLSDVKEGSGGFEIRPLDPGIPLKNNDPVINVHGKIGTTFLWNRSFNHRASMNRSDTRRRVLKLSIQHNFLENSSFTADFFTPVREGVKGDPYLAFLLGSQHISSHNGYVMPEVTKVGITSKELPKLNAAASIGAGKQFIRRVRRAIKHKLGRSARK